MDQHTWKVFDLITKFVSDLEYIFGTKQHSLLLYNRLISKTKVSHKDAISKHVAIFTKFISNNQQAILDKDNTKMVDSVILYSKKVNIKMDEIFRMSDKDTSESIWKHLLVIMNTISPNNEAVNVLKKSLEEKSGEGDFLNNLVSKIEKNVDPNSSDPMAAIMGLMSSGVIGDFIGSMNTGMQDGSLNIGKLFSTVQTMMTSLGGDIPNMPNIPNIPNIPVTSPPNTSTVTSTMTTTVTSTVPLVTTITESPSTTIFVDSPLD